jgi:hypothetical protein
MAFTATHDSSETKAYRVKALALLLIFALMLPISPIWASSEPASATVTSAVAAGEVASTQLENSNKKNDLTGFFTIGAIINVLFLGGFLLWARKESQKGKKKKAGAKQ